MCLFCSVIGCLIGDYLKADWGSTDLIIHEVAGSEANRGSGNSHEDNFELTCRRSTAGQRGYA